MKQTVDEQWQDFLEVVIPNDAPPIQRQEMKRAFYAGATAMLDLVCVVSEDEEEIAHQKMSGLAAELGEFAQQVADGKA